MNPARANFVFLSILLTLCSLSIGAGPAEPSIEDAIPRDNESIALNARLWTFGAVMDDDGGAIQCADIDEPATDCSGRLFSFSRITPVGAGYFGDIVFGSEFPSLEAGEDVLVDVFQSGIRLERRYIVGFDDDTEPPTAPFEVSVQSEVQRIGGTAGQDGATLEFGWEASTDDFGVAYYRLETVTSGESQLLNVRKSRRSGRHRVSIQVDPGEQVTAIVRAVDISGNISPASENVTGTSDFLPPECNCNGAAKSSSGVLLGAMCLLGVSIALRKRRLSN